MTIDRLAQAPSVDGLRSISAARPKTIADLIRQLRKINSKANSCYVGIALGSGIGGIIAAESFVINKTNDKIFLSALAAACGVVVWKEIKYLRRTIKERKETEGELYAARKLIRKASDPSSTFVTTN